jgi:NADP-dependent 3-hydroxy acid dehydrogenase YdfG
VRAGGCYAAVVAGSFAESLSLTELKETSIMSQSNTGKVWFITGASRGFGALVAKQALDRGDRVVATARKPQTVTERLGEQPNLLAVKLDVTNEADAQQAVQHAVERFGRIDVLVNNAGYGLLGAVEESSDSEVRAVFGTNVFGLLNVTRAVLPQMRAQRSGHVINISSIGGYSSYQGWGVYGATKFAVEGLSEALASWRHSASSRRLSSRASSVRISSTTIRWSRRNCISTTTQKPWARCGISRPVRTISSRAIRRGSRRR